MRHSWDAQSVNSAADVMSAHSHFVQPTLKADLMHSLGAKMGPSSHKSETKDVDLFKKRRTLFTIWSIFMQGCSLFGSLFTAIIMDTTEAKVLNSF